MTTKKELTACGKCKYMDKHLDVAATGLYVEKVYQYLCLALPRKNTFDHIAGEFIKGEHFRCRRINVDGHCPHYKEK